MVEEKAYCRYEGKKQPEASGRLQTELGHEKRVQDKEGRRSKESEYFGTQRLTRPRVQYGW